MIEKRIWVLTEIGRWWFYECVNKKTPKLQNPRTPNKLKIKSRNDKTEVNVTPVVRVEQAGGLKGLWGLMAQFVAVGGDFV